MSAETIPTGNPAAAPAPAPKPQEPLPVRQMREQAAHYEAAIDATKKASAEDGVDRTASLGELLSCLSRINSKLPK